MRPDDFLKDEAGPFGFGTERKVNRDLLISLRRRPHSETDEAELAVALARLVHDEFEAFGTDGGTQLNEAEIRDALLALRAVAKRIGLGDIDIPFRDYGTFKSYWLRNDGYGSWQARRDMLNTIFDPIHDRLIECESRTLDSSLAPPVSPAWANGVGEG